jgi:hypothetical protein
VSLRGFVVVVSQETKKVFCRSCVDQGPGQKGRKEKTISRQDQES